MPLVINTNVASLNAQRGLEKVNESLAKNFRHLSTGLRIASASDDAAGLAISERLRKEVVSLSQAKRNANDAVSMISTAEGALGEVGSLLVRMRELAVQASNDTVSDTDRDTLDAEFSQVISEIDRIAQGTKFGDIELTNASTTFDFQVGSGTTTSDKISLTFSSVLASDLGISSLDISSASASGPASALDAIDTAIDTVSALRGTYGATQNRLDSVVSNLGISIENLSAAKSRISDVDVAVETADLTRNSILQQAALSILGQANVQPQAALNLLG